MVQALSGGPGFRLQSTRKFGRRTADHELFGFTSGALKLFEQTGKLEDGGSGLSDLSFEWEEIY
jgi:hypothetical protein